MPLASVAPPQLRVTVDLFVQTPGGCVELDAVRPAGGTTSWPSARATFSLPPVATASPGTASALSRTAFRSSAAFSAGRSARTSAAAPATCGAAIDVPCRNPYVSPAVVLAMDVPGAPTSTD